MISDYGELHSWRYHDEAKYLLKLITARHTTSLDECLGPTSGSSGEFRLSLHSFFFHLLSRSSIVEERESFSTLQVN